RDRRRHRVGAGTRKRRRHRDGRKIDRWQRGDRKEPVARNAEHQNAGHQQRRPDRLANEDLGYVHGPGASPGCASASPAGAVGAREIRVFGECGDSPTTLTLTPCVKRYCPSTTTRSPAARPLSITASPSWVMATVMSRRSTL